MAKFFKLALEEELSASNIVDDNIEDTNPDSVLELTDAEIATEEFNQCQDELYKYVVAIEEATEAAGKVADQIAENERLIEEAGLDDVSDINMAIATESLHNIANSIGYDGLNGIKLSSEGFGSNKDKLKIAIEAGKGIIESIIDAIKKFFSKIITFIKKLYIKFVAWLNIYDKKLMVLKKDFHNIFHKENIILDAGLLLSICREFPFFISGEEKVKNIKEILQTRLAIDKWFEHLTPLNYSHTVAEISACTFIETQLKIPYIDKIAEFVKSHLQNTNEYCAAITYFKGNIVRYILAVKNDDGTFSPGEIRQESLGFADQKVVTNNNSVLTMSARDFSDMVDNVSKNLTRNLKLLTDEILKTQEKIKESISMLDNKPEMPDLIKNNLKIVQSIGGRMSVDMCLTIMNAIKSYIKVMVKIYNDTSTAIPNYHLLIECYNKHGLNAELKYLKDNKKYPYIYSKDIFDEVSPSKDAKHSPCGGFCISILNDKDVEKFNNGADKIFSAISEYLRLAAKEGMSIYSANSIIHLNTDSVEIDPAFVYFHEMGHAVLDQQENLDERYWKAYREAQNISDSGRDSGLFGGSVSQAYMYTENPVEVQADAFACVMTGGTWKTTWYKRFHLRGWRIAELSGYEDWWRSLGLTEDELKEKRENYRKLFEKCTNDAKKWANASILARIKSSIKSKF